MVDEQDGQGPGLLEPGPLFMPRVSENTYSETVRKGSRRVWEPPDKGPLIAKMKVLRPVLMAFKSSIPSSLRLFGQFLSAIERLKLMSSSSKSSALYCKIHTTQRLCFHNVPLLLPG